MGKGRLLEIKKNSLLLQQDVECNRRDLLELINHFYVIPFVLPFNLLILIWNLSIEISFK